MKTESSGMTIEKADIDAITKAKMERVARSCGYAIGDYIAFVIEKKAESIKA